MKSGSQWGLTRFVRSECLPNAKHDFFRTVHFKVVKGFQVCGQRTRAHTHTHTERHTETHRESKTHTEDRHTQNTHTETHRHTHRSFRSVPTHTTIQFDLPKSEQTPVRSFAASGSTGKLNGFNVVLHNDDVHTNEEVHCYVDLALQTTQT